MAGRAWLTVLLLVTGGCTADVFTCGSDQECMDGEHAGVCQPQGYCSFPDAECSSGQRFGDHAGGLAGQCVSEGGSTGVATGAATGVGSSDGPGGTSSGQPPVDGTTTSPPPMTTTGAASADTSVGLPDLGSRPDMGVPTETEYGPCGVGCGLCLEHGSGHEVCTQGCAGDDDCSPLQTDEGKEYPMVCSGDAFSNGAMDPGCVVTCNLNRSCPAGTECIFVRQGLNACMWPAGG